MDALQVVGDREDHRRRIFLINRFYAPDISATSQLVSELASGLAVLGLNIHVLTSQLTYDGQRDRLVASEEIDGVKVLRIWTSNFGRTNVAARALDYLTFHLSALVILLRVLRAGDTIIVKSDPPLISVVAMMAAWMRGARQVNWLQDLFPETAAAARFKLAMGWPGAALRYLRNGSLRFADLNVVIGESMMHRLVAEGIDPGKIRILPNWAVGNVAPVRRIDNPLRSLWGLTNKFVIGYSGNLGFAHEFESILRAAARLSHREEIIFLFIGGGKHFPNLLAEVESRGLTNILFKPYQPISALANSLSVPDVHLVSLLPAFEGLVVPSKFYGVAAAARPIIAISDPEGEIARLIKRCRGGFVVAPNDTDALVSAIEASLASPALRQSMGEALQRHHGSNERRHQVVQTWAQIIAAGDAKANCLATNR